MGLGYVEGVTHDYIRHGNTTLLAALNVATSEVITQCKRCSDFAHRSRGRPSRPGLKIENAWIGRSLPVGWWLRCQEALPALRLGITSSGYSRCHLVVRCDNLKPADPLRLWNLSCHC